jgi:hypothetical protein
MRMTSAELAWTTQMDPLSRVCVERDVGWKKQKKHNPTAKDTFVVNMVRISRK